MKDADVRREELAEELHKWYLEATMNLQKQSFNPMAQKPYKDLTSEQQYIDRFIADKILSDRRRILEEVLEPLEDIRKSMVGCDSRQDIKRHHADIIDIELAIKRIKEEMGEV